MRFDQLFCRHEWVFVASLIKAGTVEQKREGRKFHTVTVHEDLEEIHRCCRKCLKARFLYRRPCYEWDKKLYVSDNGIIEI